MYYRTYTKKFKNTFASSETITKNTVPINIESSENKYAGFPVLFSDNIYQTTKPEMNCLIIGETGSCKTRRVIIPSILLKSSSHENMVITDPKGELLAFTQNSLLNQGYKIKVLNLKKPLNGNQYNPFAQIEALYQSHEKEKQNKAMLELKEIAMVLKESVHNTDDSYWEKSAISWFLGVAELILKYGKSHDLTFSNISYVSNTLYKNLSEDDYVSNYLDFLPPTSSIRQNLGSIADLAAAKTKSCIKSTFDAMLSNFISQEDLKLFMSADEFHFSYIDEENVAIFIILDENSSALYSIASLFIRQLYSSLIHKADLNIDGKLSRGFSFILDEFANIVPIPEFTNMITAARSRNITIAIVVQSLEQLSERYQASSFTIISNCQVWYFLGGKSPNFLNIIQELTGVYTSEFGTYTCPLIDINSLLQLEPGQMLILYNRCLPIFTTIPDFSKVFNSNRSIYHRESPIQTTLNLFSFEKFNFAKDMELKNRLSGTNTIFRKDE